MSVKNKAKDRDKNGRIRRKYTGPHSTGWLSGAPNWFVREYMNVPKRRANKRLCHKSMCGADPDELLFPLGNRKPHVYYW